MIYIFCGLRKYRKRNILKFIPVAAPAPFNKDQGFNPSTRHTEECIWKPAPRVDPSLVGKYGYRWWQNHRKVHSEATDIALQGRFWAAGIFLIRLDSLILFVRMKQIINKWQNFFSELNYFRGNKQLSVLRFSQMNPPFFFFVNRLAIRMEITHLKWFSHIIKRYQNTEIFWTFFVISI